jgi:hypothetical protein
VRALALLGGVAALGGALLVPPEPLAAHLVAHGLIASVAAPLLALAAPPLRVPAALGWGAFVAVMWIVHVPVPHTGAGAHAALLAASLAFWLAALALDGQRRLLFLLTAMPAADLAALWLMANGEPAAGAVMTAASLPIALAAVVGGWAWLQAEERAATGAE